MSQTRQPQTRSEVLRQVEEMSAHTGWPIAGPDDPVYQDKSITMRSLSRLPSRSKPTSPEESSPPPS